MKSLTRMRRSKPHQISPEHTAWIWQAASLLLDYPDEQLPERLDLVERVARAVPGRSAELLDDCQHRLRGVALVDLQADYVGTFDTRRRHNLFLTYFAHGDTRKRGMALLRFKQTYLESGVELGPDGQLANGELPDHLCVVLEYGAAVDLERGRQLLLDHRAGLELLNIGLTKSDSPWAGAVQAVSATLPPLAGDQMSAVRRLAAEGPPAEEVGLSPYAIPGFDPAPAVQLPMPTFRGAR